MKDPEYRAEYEKLGELTIPWQLRLAREYAGLDQQGLADRMGTTQSVISRMENGHSSPTLKTLKEWAQACGMSLKIEHEPIEADG